MNTYQFSFEKKYTIWYRGIVDIEAESLEQATRIVQNAEYDGMIAQADDDEPLYDTLSTIDVSENNGYATEEIRCCHTNDIVWDNAEGSRIDDDGWEIESNHIKDEPQTEGEQS